MVEQIVSNLIENALKYSPPEAAVDVGVQTRGGWLTIEVADRGRGVAPRERERIFEKFYRAPGRTAGKSGSGIGLAIARGLAQAHDGDVHYFPRAGGGSIFSLRLSLTVGEPAPIVP